MSFKALFDSALIRNFHDNAFAHTIDERFYQEIYEYLHVSGGLNSIPAEIRVLIWNEALNLPRELATTGYAPTNSDTVMPEIHPMMQINQETRDLMIQAGKHELLFGGTLLGSNKTFYNYFNPKIDTVFLHPCGGPDAELKLSHNKKGSTSGRTRRPDPPQLPPGLDRIRNLKIALVLNELEETLPISRINGLPLLFTKPNQIVETMPNLEKLHILVSVKRELLRNRGNEDMPSFATLQSTAVEAAPVGSVARKAWENLTSLRQAMNHIVYLIKYEFFDGNKVSFPMEIWIELSCPRFPTFVHCGNKDDQTIPA